MIFAMLKRFFLVSTLILITMFKLYAQWPKTGIYEGLGSLYIANNNNTITGFFQNYRGSGFSTLFFLHGDISGKSQDSIHIRIYYPPDTAEFIEGFIRLLDSTRLIIKLAETPPGDCFGLDDNESEFSLNKKYDWKEITYIKTKSSYLYFRPSEKERSKSYLVKFDCIAIIERRSDWSKIDFIGKTGLKRGWIKLNTIAY